MLGWSDRRLARMHPESNRSRLHLLRAYRRPHPAWAFASRTHLGRKGETMAVNDSLNIVLVHGGFVDGSGWASVYNFLKRDGHRVSVVQNPTLSLEGDVAAT